MSIIRGCLLIALILSLVASPVVSAEGIIAPPVTAEPSEDGNARPRPTERPFSNPWSQPQAQAQLRAAKELEAAPEQPRSNDPVLQWLPEIQAASDATGTPRTLIMGVMQLESGGVQTAVSVVGAQGLMQVMPVELQAQGIPQELWQDPATNIMAGARILADRSGAGWEMATAYYFGIGCDAYGTCTGTYVTIAVGWANYFAAILGDAIWFDANNVFGLPTGPSQPPTTPAPPTATPTPKPGTTPTVPPATEQPGTDPTSTPVPTTPPTAVPTMPAPQPTAVPTEIPTEVPTAVPTEVPTEPPPPPPTEPPAEPIGADVTPAA